MSFLNPAKEHEYANELLAALRAGKAPRTVLVTLLRNSQVIVPDEMCVADGLPSGTNIGQLLRHLRNPTPRASTIATKPTVCPLTQPMTILGRRASSKRLRAEAFIREQLAHGPQVGSELTKLAKHRGIAPSTLVQVTRRLGVIKRPKAFGAGWVWALPESIESPV